MPDYNVRAAPLRSIPSLLSALGCSPRPILESTGFAPKDFEIPEKPVPYAEAATLIETSATVSGCEFFGLKLGQSFSLDKLGLVGTLTSTSANVESALRELIENFYLHDSGGIITLNRKSRMASVGYKSIAPTKVSVCQVNDMCVACLCLVMRSLCGTHWNPARVEFARPKPVAAACYTEFFRAPIIFGATETALVFSNQWLEFPLSSADPDKHQTLTEMAREFRGSSPPGLATAVRRLLHQGLTSGGSTSNQISESLGIHERTLRRRLRNENTSFSVLLEEVRQTISFHYLNDTTLPIRDIASLLGYGSTNAFDHAFRRWFGASPLHWRKVNRTLNLNPARRQ